MASEPRVAESVQRPLLRPHQRQRPRPRYLPSRRPPRRPPPRGLDCSGSPPWRPRSHCHYRTRRARPRKALEQGRKSKPISYATFTNFTNRRPCPAEIQVPLAGLSVSLKKLNLHCAVRETREADRPCCARTVAATVPNIALDPAVRKSAQSPTRNCAAAQQTDAQPISCWARLIRRLGATRTMTTSANTSEPISALALVVGQGRQVERFDLAARPGRPA